MALQQTITHSGNRSALRVVRYSESVRHYKAYDYTHLKDLGIVGDETKEDLAETGREGKEQYPITIKKDFHGKAGDELVDPMLEPLSATSTSGFAGEYLIHTNTGEAAMTLRNMHLFIHTLKNAAGFQGDMSEQRVAFDLKKLTKQSLENWSSRRWEVDAYYTFYNGYSPHVALSSSSSPAISNGLGKGVIANPNIVYAGSATSAINVGEGDVLDVDLLERLGSYCVYNRIQPVMMRGYKPIWVLLSHTLQYRSLRMDPQWRTARLDGMPRGEKNHQVFTRASGIWGDILVIEVPGQDFIATPANAAAGGENYAQKRRALLLGGGALYYAEVPKTRRLVPLNETEYGDYTAWCLRNIEGMRRGDWQPDPSDDTYHNQSVVEVVTYAANTF